MTRAGKPQKRTGIRYLSGILLSCLLLLAVWQLPAFRLQRIDLPEMRSIEKEDFLEASGLAFGHHLLQGLGGTPGHWLNLRYGAVESRLQQQFPVIESVKVSLDFPSAMKVDVIERVEVAYLAVPDGCVMIDKNGVAIRIWPEAPEEIPVIEGVNIALLHLGQALVVDVPEAMNSAISMMGAIIEADRDVRTDIPLLAHIRSIRPVSGRQAYLAVLLPDTGAELTVLAEVGSGLIDDMIWLRFALEQGVLENRGKGVLNMTGSRRTFMPD